MRLEDERLLRGQGRFVSALELPGMAHAVIVRSSHAHAKIRKIEAEGARSMPGVLAVYTALDLAAQGVKPLGFHAAVEAEGGGPMRPPPRHALATDTVRYVGEPVALVVAETRDQALDASEKIDIDIEPLPAVTGAENGVVVGLYEYGERAAVEEALRSAHRVVSLRVVNNRVAPCAMEPRAALAEPGLLHAANQTPHMARRLLCEVLGLPPEALHVRVRDVGGGFGSKVAIYPEDVLVVFAARVLGRPVKWVASRGEAFLSDTHGRDHVSHCELGLDARGRFLALRVRDYADMGAYVSFFGAAIATRTGNRVANGAYDIPAIHAEVRAVLTNTVPTGPYRGAGRPETVYRLERLIDVAAAEAGIDPTELRRRNLIPKRRIPYTNVVGQVYESGDFPRVLEAALAHADREGFAARRAEAARRGKLLGWGLAYHIDTTSGMEPSETATVLLKEDTVTVLSGTQAMGQGLETVYAELVSEAMGVKPQQVCIVQGDTERVPSGVGSYGSRSLYIGGSAIVAAARACLVAAPGPDGTRSASATATAPFCFPNGCHICEAEIDRETGTVHIARYTAVDDVGTVLHRTIVHGQTWGGVVQGIGQALMEQVVFEPGSAQLLSGSLMDYALPRADVLESMTSLLDERSPSSTNLLGAKGAGEGGALGAPPAVAAAVADALRGFGVRHIDMPLSAEKIWRIIRTSNPEE
jgi:aerobic carbon-monoxide dehydrogenase large subunit